MRACVKKGWFLVVKTEGIQVNIRKRGASKFINIEDNKLIPCKTRLG